MWIRNSASVLALVVLTWACGKKAADTPGTAATPTQETARPATDAAQDEKAAALAHATMEDAYLKDTDGQWAQSASASSTYGEGPGVTPTENNLASNMVGAPDTKTWTNAKQDMGFDTAEAFFAKPVNAVEIRVVLDSGQGAEAISKLEVRDEAGAWSSVWEGLSDVKRDTRGSRTWFVKKFPATAAKVNGVRVTIANTVERGYKVIDAIQLVGK